MTSPSRHRPRSSRADRAGRKQTRKGHPAASEGSGFHGSSRTSVSGQELGGSTERGSPARGLAHVLFYSLGSSPYQPSATGTREIQASRGGLRTLAAPAQRPEARRCRDGGRSHRQTERLGPIPGRSGSSAPGSSGATSLASLPRMPTRVPSAPGRWDRR